MGLAECSVLIKLLLKVCDEEMGGKLPKGMGK